MNRMVQRIVVAGSISAFVVCAASRLLESKSAAAVQSNKASSIGKIDPAAWGTDHVSKPLPDFVSGDECLFCHRNEFASTWKKNRHQLTIRPADTEPAAMAALNGSPSARALSSEVEFVLGARNRVRYLKRTQHYGQLAILSTAWKPAAEAGVGALIDPQDSRWDARAFGASCAGCHATAVDAKTQTFSAVSLDCFTCHGDVPLEHSKDASRVYLSKRRPDPAHVVVSICGQCHVRSGKSRSTGLAFANNFVAGDNLFRDLDVDWSDAHLKSLNPGDRHVLENVRDVAVHGDTRMTCLSCHEVHSQTTRKHKRLADGAICINCHQPGDLSIRKKYQVHSRTCDY